MSEKKSNRQRGLFIGLLDGCIGDIDYKIERKQKGKEK